jgi:hypothetical protein
MSPGIRAVSVLAMWPGARAPQVYWVGLRSGLTRQVRRATRPCTLSATALTKVQKNFTIIIVAIIRLFESRSKLGANSGQLNQAKEGLI